MSFCVEASSRCILLIVTATLRRAERIIPSSSKNHSREKTPETTLGMMSQMCDVMHMQLLYNCLKPLTHLVDPDGRVQPAYGKV